MLREVKSVSLVEGGIGLFPDAVTARGARHVRELAALRRSGDWAAAVLFVLQRPDAARIRLGLNEASPELEVRPAAVEEALGLSLFWSIPHDRMLRRAGQLGEAVIEAHPTSPAARRISDLARVLSGVPVGERGRGRQGLFGRLLSRRNGKHAPVEDKMVTEEVQA